MEDNDIWHESNTNKRLINIEKSKKGKLGIYDMLGNIYEWCEDSCNNTSNTRIAKGGSFKNKREDIKIKKRICLLAFNNDKNNIGFRIISRKPRVKFSDNLKKIKKIILEKMSNVGEIDNKKLLSMEKNDFKELYELLIREN